MREILFRGKVIDGNWPPANIQGEWVEGSLVHQTEYYGDPVDRYHILYTGEFDMDYYDSAIVDPKTIGQFTGLLDKNGKKIFEGDIIRALMDFGPAGLIESIVPVYFDTSVGGYQWNYFNMSTIEVIGNIYDNPELLGE